MKSYALPESTKLSEMISEADKLQAVIDEACKEKLDLWQTIQEKLRIDWTYDSNAIEGSHLTRGETMFFLQEGRTAEGKPFKDYLDARNHAEAIDMLYGYLSDKRPISESMIKAFNARLLHGVDYTSAIDQLGHRVKKIATPGEYKKNPNHVQRPDGSIHHYVNPIQVSSEMAQLCQWIETNQHQIHPTILGAVAHYNFVRIHPFDDGNGRGGRLLMNHLIMHRGFVPAIIRNEKRRLYLNAITEANNGDMIPFTEFIAKSLIDTQKRVVTDLGD